MFSRVQVALSVAVSVGCLVAAGSVAAAMPVGEGDARWALWTAAELALTYVAGRFFSLALQGK